MSFGFVFREEDCIGCGECQIACKDANNLPVGVFFRRVKTTEKMTEQGLVCHFVMESCRHCGNPHCLNACPHDAILKGQDGAVRILSASCTGCGACVRACPFERISLLKTGGESCAAKCDSCLALRLAGKEPACVAACMTGALTLQK